MTAGTKLVTVKLVRSVFGFESSGVTLDLDSCSFRNMNSTDYNYLAVSVAECFPFCRIVNSGKTTDLNGNYYGASAIGEVPPFSVRTLRGL